MKVEKIDVLSFVLTDLERIVNAVREGLKELDKLEAS